MRHFNKALPIIALSLLFASAVPAETQYSGQAVFVKGTVAAKHPQLNSRPLKTDNDIYLNDRIETGDRSYSILELLDKGKITVRPLTHFSVLQYSLSKNLGRLRLDRGGVKLETGIIAETSPDRQTIETPLANIDVQQARLRLRLCEQDCAKDEKRAKKKHLAVTREVVGRIVELKGNALAVTKLPAPLKGKQNRNLSVGAPVYRHDRLITSDQSYLLVVFRDSGRITLVANSELQVKDYRWRERGTSDTMVLRLVRGGLRALTGKLGRGNPDNYVMETPVATIGIRGTLYDLLLEQPPLQGAPKQPVRQYTYVRYGSIDVSNQAGTFHLKELTGNVLRQSAAPPETITGIPDSSAIHHAPTPESSTVDMQSQFAEESLSGVPGGLYLFVEDGHVRVSGNKGQVLHLGRHETLYIDNSGHMRRLDRPKNFLLQKEEPEDDKVATAASAPVKPTTCNKRSYWSKKYNKCLCKRGSYWSKKHKKCLCKKGFYYSKKYKECRKSRPKCAKNQYYNTKSRECVTRKSDSTGKAILGTIIKGLIIHGANRHSRKKRTHREQSSGSQLREQSNKYQQSDQW